MENFTFTAQDSLQLERFLLALNQNLPAAVLRQSAGGAHNVEDLKKRLVPYTYITLTHPGGGSYPDGELKTVVGGIRKYLGYREEDFNFRKSMTIIFDIFRVFVIEYGRVVYGLLQQDEIRKKITPHTYYSIPYLVRHANPNRGLVQVIQHSSAYDQYPDGSIAVQINVCQVLTDISPNALMRKPTFSHPCEGYMDRELKELHDTAIPRILDKIRQQNNNRPLLSPREYQLACLLSEGHPAGDIARHHMDSSLDTIRKHCRNMLGKFRNWFPEVVQAADAHQAAHYLKNLGFLDYPKCYIQ